MEFYFAKVVDFSGFVKEGGYGKKWLCGNLV